MMNSPAKTNGGQESFDAKQREAIRLPDGCMLVLSSSHLRDRSRPTSPPLLTAPVLLCSGEVSQLCMKNFVLEGSGSGKNGRVLGFPRTRDFGSIPRCFVAALMCILFILQRVSSMRVASGMKKDDHALNP
jgi:hypothetical protein